MFIPRVFSSECSDCSSGVYIHTFCWNWSLIKFLKKFGLATRVRMDFTNPQTELCRRPHPEWFKWGLTGEDLRFVFSMWDYKEGNSSWIAEGWMGGVGGLGVLGATGLRKVGQRQPTVCMMELSLQSYWIYRVWVQFKGITCFAHDFFMQMPFCNFQSLKTIKVGNVLRIIKKKNALTLPLVFPPNFLFHAHFIFLRRFFLFSRFLRPAIRVTEGMPMNSVRIRSRYEGKPWCECQEWAVIAGLKKQPGTSIHAAYAWIAGTHTNTLWMKRQWCL